MSRTRFQNEREKFARDSEEKFTTRIRTMQDRLYSAILDIVAGLAVDEAGRLAFTVGNMTKVNRVSTIVSGFHGRENKGLLSWVFSKLGGLFGLNRRYFTAFNGKNETVDDRVRRLIMLRYGFDTTKNAIVAGGYLSGLASSDAVGQRIAERINTAIAGRMPLNQFRKTFRAEFINPGGLGILESHYNRVTHDLFQEFDRNVQSEYATELGLDFAIYSGTVIQTSRDFCELRNNNVYSRETIESWNAQEWQGKKQGVDVKVQCGGFNCRHHFSWISEELAKRIAPGRGGVDNFN